MDAAAELGRNPVSTRFSLTEYGDEQADAGRDYRTNLERLSSQARTGTGKNSLPSSTDHERIGNLTRLIITLARHYDDQPVAPVAQR